MYSLKVLLLVLLCVTAQAQVFNTTTTYAAAYLKASASGGGGGSVYFQDPASLTGNLHWLIPENLGTQSDGALIALARRYTNDVSGSGANMYSYHVTGLPLTNNVQNGKAGVWMGEGSQGTLINEVNITVSNYLMVASIRIDSEQVAGNLVVDLGSILRVYIDQTRTNYLNVRVFDEATYRFTNEFTRGVPIVFGVQRQGTNLVAFREYGQVGLTNAISPILTNVAFSGNTYGIFGNTQTGSARPRGYVFNWLLNTNASLDLTNLANVVYYSSNRLDIHQ